MMLNPKLSIITPVWNGEQYIAACILSVANQTYKNIEHVIVDGSSTDGTLDIVKKYAREYSHIRWVSQEKRGIYGDMNAGISIARGDWLYFLGADDILADSKVLENIFTGHKSIADNSDFIYGNVIWGDTGEIYDGYFDIQKLYHKNICHQAIFVRKGVFDKIGKFLTEYELLADWHFNILCFIDPEIRKSYIGTVVAKFRISGASSSKTEIAAKEKHIIHDIWLENVGIRERVKLEFRFRMKLFNRISNLIKGAHLLGIRPAYFVAPSILSFVAVFFEGVTVAALIIFVKGILSKDFTFVSTIPVLKNAISLLSHFFEISNGSIFAILICTIFISSVAKTFLSYISSMLVAYQTQLALRNIRQLVFGRYLSFGKMYFDRTNSGELYNTLIHYTAQSAQQLGNLQSIISTLIMFAFYLIAMFFISWKLTIVMLVSFPILNYSSKMLIDKIKKTSGDTAIYSDDLSRNISNILSCIPLVKQYAEEEHEKNRFSHMNTQLSMFELSLIKKYSLIMPLQELIFISATLILVSLMGVLILMKDKSASIATFTAYIYILRRSQGGFGVLNSLKAAFAQVKGPIDHIRAVFSTHDKFLVPEGNKIFAGLRQSLDFSHLDFAYTKNRKILKDVTFSIEKGKIVALVGPTGAGKTTIASLLLRFYDCPPSSLLLDGEDIRSFTIKSIMTHIAYVSQDVLLFNDTIRNNILYGIDRPVSENDLLKVIQDARLYDFVTSLPDGLNTHVGDRGVKLSGGEKQRVSIARALIKKAEILILDEATSSLDSKTERLIQEAIDAVLRDRTAIVIAHRLSTVKNVDKIVVIDEGKIVEEGPLQELLNKRGKFYEFWEEQKFY